MTGPTRGRRGGQRGKGRDRGNPNSSAAGRVVLDRSTTPTDVSIRFPSKDTPTVIQYLPRHPFTEEVGPTNPLPASAKALDFFLHMFDHDLMEHIVVQTNLYARTREGHSEDWVDLTVSEFQSFLGTLILMAVTRLPNLHNYWSTNYYLGAPHIECLTLYKPHRENSVDEAMVKFKGRSLLKQYMPKKPIKRGYKVWCMCDAHNGFTCSFQVYLGATDSAEKELGIRAP